MALDTIGYAGVWDIHQQLKPIQLSDTHRSVIQLWTTRGQREGVDVNILFHTRLLQLRNDTFVCGISLCNNSGENLWNDPGAAGAGDTGDTGDDSPVEMQDQKEFRQKNESRLRQPAPNQARVQGCAPKLWISQNAGKVHWSQACAGQGVGNGIECCKKCLKHLF